MDINALLQSFADLMINLDWVGLATTTLFFLGVALISWVVYNWISTRDIFKLRRQHKLSKALHLSKFIFLLPGVTAAWFILYSVLLSIVSNSPVSQVFLGAVIIVAAVRIAAYIRGELAEEVAGMLPLTIVATLMLNPNFLTLETLTETLVGVVDQIPLLVQYTAFIVVIEWVMRFAFYMHQRSVAKLRGRYLLTVGKINAPAGGHAPRVTAGVKVAPIAMTTVQHMHAAKQIAAQSFPQQSARSASGAWDTIYPSLDPIIAKANMLKEQTNAMKTSGK